MPKRTKINGPASLEEIKGALKTHTQPHQQIRLLAIRMATVGQWTRAQIGQAVGKGRATIGRWLKSYQHGGIETLLDRKYAGKQPTLRSDDIDALKEVLREGRFKTAKEIAHWLKTQRGIELKLSGVYYWLSKLTGRHKVPRKVHHQQDPQQKQDFKDNITAKLCELDIKKRQTVYIWLEDEHRYGLISNIRRCWTLRGHRVTVPYQTKYQWGYIYGATELTSGKAEFLFVPTVSLFTSQLFVEQLVAVNRRAIHIIIWDRAGFHPLPESDQLPQQVRLLPLPPYCPELNPMETMWDIVKRHVANTVFSTLDAIESEIEQVLTPFWKSAQRVRTFLGDNWLTRGVAIFLEQINSKNRLVFN